MIEKVLTGSDVEIVNLYKTGSHAPYTPLEKGNFGYLGLLLARKTDGKVQCHVCGEWHSFLGPHIVKKHKQFKTISEYKHRFGFPILFPLCSARFSAKLCAANKRRDEQNPEAAKKRNERIAKVMLDNQVRKKAHKNATKSRQSASFLNRFDVCRDQTIRRVTTVMQHLKKFPSVEELIRHDSAVYFVINKRYGGWNEFKKREFPNEKINLPEKYTDDYMLFVLREFERTHKRVPIRKDFLTALPNTTTFLNRFGSWSRALTMAGLQVNPKETKTYRKAG